VVEKVTPGGDLSIVAGSGQSGAPTPGPATSSSLGTTSGVAVSSSGDLYISDKDNNVIEKVTPGGDLSIVAGTGEAYQVAVPGPAEDSPIDEPGGLALDSSGNLYVSQLGLCDVLKIDTSGTLSIFAGGGCGKPTPGPATSSPLLFPHGLATDPSGNLYIAATGSNLVVKVDTSGTLSIVAGVRDTGQQCMTFFGNTYCFDLPNQGSPTPGPATSSRLNGPEGLAVDAKGNLYIADRYNNVVEEVDASGNLSTLAWDVYQPQGLAVDSAGNLYASTYDNVIKKLGLPIVLPDPTTPSISNLPSSGTAGDLLFPSVSTNGDGTKSVTSSTTDVCSIYDVLTGTIRLNAPGTCTLTAHVGAGSNYAAADGTAQSFEVGRATASTPSISNLPSSASNGLGFVPAVSTTGDGTKSVTSSTTDVCSVVDPITNSVAFNAPGTCTLTAHVAEGSNYWAADGSAQSFTVGKVEPSTPEISNLPGSGTYGGSFTPSVSTTGDGTTSVTSSTTGVCTVDGTTGLVSYVGVGVCALVAHVAEGADYASADGSDQYIGVLPATPSTPSISNLPGSGTYGRGFVPTVSTTGDGTKSVTSSTTDVCSVVDPVTNAVAFNAPGTCTLTAHVGEGSNYSAADGSAQSFEVLPEAPTLRGVGRGQATTITVFWGAPSITAGPISAYVAVARAGGVVRGYCISPSTHHSCRIRGLQSGVDYFVSVVAYERTGKRRTGFTMVTSASSSERIAGVR